jgi:hypothetical protein
MRLLVDLCYAVCRREPDVATGGVDRPRGIDVARGDARRAQPERGRLGSPHRLALA